MNDIAQYFTDPYIGYDEKMVFADELIQGARFTQAVENAKARMKTDVLRQNIMGVYGNIWFRNIHLDPGERVDQHSHEHAHITLVATGSIKAELEGYESRIYHAGEAVPVPANVLHSFSGLEPNTEVFCTYAVRNLEGEMMDWEDCLKLMKPLGEKEPYIHANKFVPELNA